MLNLTLQEETKQVSYYTEPVGTSVGIDMILVPGGNFMMGSPDDEPGREKNEGPQHQVTVPAFFMGRYPVTQAQYEAVMATNPATDYDAERFVVPDKPIIGVSWDDTIEFCRRLSAQSGREYRLPSEAEWEYACRAGTTTPFYFGPILTTDLANYRGNYTYNDSPVGEFRNGTTPVTHFEYANAWGLSDMHGNVWEWCLDHWHASYEDAPTDGSAWLTEDENASRVLRGGSWYDFPGGCRSAYRNHSSRENRPYNYGFRVVSVAPRTLP
ncbi:MAG: formylglycine-generating enzyme family protein [Cyanobacteria bacterium J06639_14]